MERSGRRGRAGLGVIGTGMAGEERTECKGWASCGVVGSGRAWQA